MAVCEATFWPGHYDVYEECCAVVHISKKPYPLGRDLCHPHILDPRDEIMALMLAIAIDAANCTK